jgi:hypothetical protein
MRCLVFGSDYHVINQRSGACRWEHRAYLGIGGCVLVYIQGRTPCVVYNLGAQDDEAGSWFVGIQLIKLILVTTNRYIYTNIDKESVPNHVRIHILFTSYTTCLT